MSPDNELENANAIDVIVYLQSTGEIKRTVTCSPDVAAILARTDDERVMRVFDSQILDTTHYVVNGEITPRPKLGYTWDGRWLRGLPVPSVVEINGIRYDCDEADVEIELDQYGEYVFYIHAFPYAMARFEYTYENQA